MRVSSDAYGDDARREWVEGAAMSDALLLAGALDPAHDIHAGDAGGLVDVENAVHWFGHWASSWSGGVRSL